MGNQMNIWDKVARIEEGDGQGVSEEATVRKQRDLKALVDAGA